MPHPIPLEDFRSRRYVFDPEDFAWGPEEPDPPPSDLIEEDVWSGIMHLTDDVAIRTSNEYGTLLKWMYDLWGSWFEAIGEEQDPIWHAMLDTGDELQAITFNALHGFYRQAIGGLRNVVELMTVGLDFQFRRETATEEFAKWRAGDLETLFGKACDRLIAATAVQPLRAYLKRELEDGIFEQKTPERPGGWARRLYETLSNYAHSRPSYTMGDLWESNGPVFVPEVFVRTASLFFETVTYSYILVKLGRTRFELPESVGRLFSDEHIQPTKIAHLSYDFLYRPSESSV